MQYGRLKFSHKSGIKKIQKKCCSVAKQKQHTHKKMDLNNITEERKLKEEFNKEFQEWDKFFGYNPRLFEYLGSNVRMYECMQNKENREKIEMKKIRRNPNRWIFTKERLPEEGKWYLALQADGYITTDLFSKIENSFMNVNTVAWMEIPTPPIKGRLTY